MPLPLLFHTNDAAEAEMAGGGIDRLCHARRRPVAAAIIRRAQIRAALHHFARYFDVRRGGIIALVMLCASGVKAGAA